MKENNKSRALIFCEICGFKKIVDCQGAEPDLTGFAVIPTSKIQGGIPALDPETKKIVNKNHHPRSQKVKCKQCGRGVVVKKLPDVYAKSFAAIDAEEQKKKAIEERKRRIQDGLPSKKSENEEFLG